EIGISSLRPSPQRQPASRTPAAGEPTVYFPTRELEMMATADRVIDVRWLDPPEPFERIVAALEELPADATLRVLIHREPLPIYGKLESWGYRHQTRFDEEGYFEIVITR